MSQPVMCWQFLITVFLMRLFKHDTTCVRINTLLTSMVERDFSNHQFNLQSIYKQKFDETAFEIFPKSVIAATRP